MIKKKRIRVKPYETTKFINHLNQEINPGDKVIIVTNRKSAGVGVGRYIGQRLRKSYNGEQISRVLVEYDRVRKTLIHNETGEEWKWNYEPPGLTRPKHPGYRTAPQRPYYPEAMERYNLERKAYEDLVKKEQEEYINTYKIWTSAIKEHKEKNYHEVIIPYVKRSTLYYNRIYLLDTKFKDLATS